MTLKFVIFTNVQKKVMLDVTAEKSRNCVNTQQEALSPTWQFHHIPGRHYIPFSRLTQNLMRHLIHFLPYIFHKSLSF